MLPILLLGCQAGFPPDRSAPDGGDAALDAVVDARPEDAAPDARADRRGPDQGVDAAPDAARDAIPDPAPDAQPDAAPDTEADACVPSCPEQGCASDGCGGDCCPTECVAEVCLEPAEQVMEARMGFGRVTTGGLGGAACLVSTSDNDGPGSLRDCARGEAPKWVHFVVGQDFDIHLQTPLEVGDNTTIDGRNGSPVVVRSHGLRLGANVVLINLFVAEGQGVGITAGDGASWLHHVTVDSRAQLAFEVDGPQALVTASRSRFSAVQQGLRATAAAGVTVFNSRFTGVTRGLALRGGPGHVLDSGFTVYTEWALSIAPEAQALVQGCTLDGVGEALVGGGPLRSEGNDVVRAPLESRDPGEVPDALFPYPFEVQGFDQGESALWGHQRALRAAPP